MTDRLDNLVRLQEPTTEPWRRDLANGKEVAVLMSGGVDSSVAAILLRDQGWNAVGLTMKIPMAGACSHKRACCGLEAVYVCRDLGIPHYFVEVKEAFERAVIEPFRQSYAHGRTPSPCVDCNTVVKFRLMWDLVEREFGIRNLATGHYARVLHQDGRAYLTRGLDRSRDQSYFLYGVPLERLAHLMLPVAEFDKARVREMAASANLPVARKPDSMELCFANEGDYRAAMADARSARGTIEDSSGRIVGEHEGIAGFTIGQRRGIGVASGERLYVTGISADTNTLTVGDYGQACRRFITAGELNVLIPEQLQPGARLFGKIRSQGEPAECTVECVEETVFVEFQEPQFAPSPGQRLVLYDDEGLVVCGGVILPSREENS